MESLNNNWAALGACRDGDPDLFFPESHEQSNLKAAREICAMCIVQVDCLDYALATNQQHGIWAGTSERQRRKMRRNQAKT